MQILIVTLCVRIIVRDVHIGLGVVFVHHAIPTPGVDTSHKTTVNNRQFPVFVIINLSGTGNHHGKPHRPLGVWTPCVPVAFGFMELYGVCHQGTFQSFFVHFNERIADMKDFFALNGCAVFHHDLSHCGFCHE